MADWIRMPFGVVSVGWRMDILDGVHMACLYGRGGFGGFYVPIALNGIFLKTEMYSYVKI